MPPEPPIDAGPLGLWLAEHCGLSGSVLGAHQLQRVLRQRLQASGCRDPQAYLQQLRSSPEEQQELVERLVVSETWFFRDRQPFAHLASHALRRWRAEPLRPLRLLSAPCASGEEAWSMAITLLEQGLAPQRFQIDAVDISREAIRKARRAIYGRHSFRGVSDSERRRHFLPVEEGGRALSYALRADLRPCVQFRRANLLSGLAGLRGPYDVVFCRNLLIYLEDQAAQALLQGLAALMPPGGLLVVGAAEGPRVPPPQFRPLGLPFVFGFERTGQPAAEPAVSGSVRCSGESQGLLPAPPQPVALVPRLQGPPASGAPGPREAVAWRSPAAVAVAVAGDGAAGVGGSRASRGRQGLAPGAAAAPHPFGPLAASPPGAPSVAPGRSGGAAGRARSASPGRGAGAAGDASGMTPDPAAQDRRPQAAALAELQRRLAEDPCCDRSHLDLARLLLACDRGEEAVEALQRCLYLRPDCREALEELIALSERLGQRQRSRQLQGRLARLPR
ncbi:MAG: CheR family methyltransferase [Synechococcaceae cyanobacterium]|nr:CheR family methyltransferase [Synechococcaceae cyanobacterium]